MELLVFIILFIDRGKQFRREFANISEVRSLVPAGVKIMALTATASKSSRKQIINTLCMEDVQVIAVTPNRANITYHVKRWEDGMSEAMDDVIGRLVEKRNKCERTIIYCRTINNCIDVHRYFRNKLGEAIHEPPGSPNLPQYRLVDMYCSCIHSDTQELILKHFMDLSGNLRVVIATIAFGLGLDCPDVRYVVHWGPPGNIEAYLQETGRAGRDGLPADAILYYGPGQLRKDRVSELMIYYCKNTTECRRKVLLQDFDGYRNIDAGLSCCDICVA